MKLKYAPSFAFYSFYHEPSKSFKIRIDEIGVQSKPNIFDDFIFNNKKKEIRRKNIPNKHTHTHTDKPE